MTALWSVEDVEFDRLPQVSVSVDACSQGEDVRFETLKSSKGFIQVDKYECAMGHHLGAQGPTPRHQSSLSFFVAHLMHK